LQVVAVLHGHRDLREAREEVEDEWEEVPVKSLAAVEPQPYDDETAQLLAEQLLKNRV